MRLLCNYLLQALITFICAIEATVVVRSWSVSSKYVQEDD
jgi:hypothetical protein